MKIHFQVETDKPMLYYGDETRYSSMTSVALITNKLLACASYCMSQLYLVEFDLPTQTSTILETLDTVAGPSDLLVFREKNGNHELITSDFENSSISLYEIIGSKLCYRKTISNTACGPCHGISYYPYDDDVIVFTTSGTKNPLCGVYAINTNNSQIFFGLINEGWLGKDVTFVNENIMVALFCNSAPNPMIKRYYDSKIVVYQVDLKGNRSLKLTELVIKRHHGDSCKYKGGKLYVTLQNADTQTGKVLVLDVDNITGMLTQVTELQNYSFPHGVDVYNNMIAVSEYGTSTIDIRPLLPSLLLADTF